MIYHIVTKVLIVALALLLCARFIPGIDVAGIYTAVVVAVMLGVLNLIVKPILVILTLPINILTLGLFTFVLNALLFWFVATFVEGFGVSGFFPAFLGALFISIASWLGNKFLK